MAKKPEPSAFTIAQFCARNQISQAHYFNQRAAGKGPREMRIGRSVRITPDAERDWQRGSERQSDNAA